MGFVDPQILANPGGQTAVGKRGDQGLEPGTNRRQPTSQPSQRQMEEDKKFPKCRICDYRYFTRLDLCRHFVDFHLRPRISSCIDPNNKQCPGKCHL